MTRTALASLAAAMLAAAGLWAWLGQPVRDEPRAASVAPTPATPSPTAIARPVKSHIVDGEGGRIYLGENDARAAAARGLAPPDVQSILKVDGAMRHGQYVWQDNGKSRGDLVVWVDLDRQLVSAFRGGHEIGTSVILYGTNSNSSPVGRFPITDKREDYHSRTYDAPMPYSLWLTDDGVAIHGSDVRWGRATHGCVGVPVAFARRLFAEAEEGDVVHIVRSSQIAQPAPPDRALSQS